MRRRACAGACLINEDDGGSLLARQGEQLADELLALAEPLGHEVGGGHIEEGGLRLCRHRLGQVGLTRPRWAVQQDAAPGLPLACGPSHTSLDIIFANARMQRVMLPAQALKKQECGDRDATQAPASSQRGGQDY